VCVDVDDDDEDEDEDEDYVVVVGRDVVRGEGPELRKGV